MTIKELGLIDLFNYTACRFIKYYNRNLLYTGFCLKLKGNHRRDLLASFYILIKEKANFFRSRRITNPYLSPNELADMLVDSILDEEPVTISNSKTGLIYEDDREEYNMVLSAYARLDLLLMFEVYHLSKSEIIRNRILKSISFSLPFPNSIDDEYEIAYSLAVAYRDANDRLAIYGRDLSDYFV